MFCVYDLTIEYNETLEFPTSAIGVVFKGMIYCEFNVGLIFQINTVKVTANFAIGISIKDMFYGNNDFFTSKIF